ncbi:CASH domain-dontaining protein [Candidatus Methanophagaceae archaeon]|nr:CASH domain-dontaining protein [Methanophagales archaeon]
MNIHLGGIRKTIMDRNNVKFCVILFLVLIATFVSIGTASAAEPYYVNPCGFCESTPDVVVTTSTCDLSIAYNEIANENGVVNPLWKSVVQLNNASDSVAAINNSEKPLGSSAEEYWAVIVGGNSLFAHHDAEDMYNVLTMASENWDANHIRLLVNESATKANIRDAIRWMANNANTEDTCLFFFSGHGEQSIIDDNGDEVDGLDESLRTYYNETILDDELEEWIGDVKAEKVVAILEACYCGGVLTIFQIEEVPDRDGFAQDLEKVNCVVFAACRVNEVSYNLQLLKNGIFSYYVVQGLWSVADHNTDGKISIRELYDYSYPKVVGSTETLIDQEDYNPQHPLLWPEDDIADNIYIIKLKAPAPKKISVPVEYSTIQKAIEAAMSGDTIEVATGTYNENVILNKPLTINAPYRDSIIHAANNSLPCVFITVDNTSISWLTCRNGSDGIRLFMSTNTVISNNIANYNHYQGIGLRTSSGNIIANNTAKYNEVYGIYLEESNDNRITDNDASNSVDYNGIGLNSSNNNEIRNNIANSNNLDGIRLSSHSDNNILANNIANSNKEAGILCWTSSANILTYNNVNSNDKGIWLYNYSTENIITNNTAKYNEVYGIYLDESNDNMITDNDASNSVDYDGIILDSSNSNEIRNNIANYNHQLGIGLWTSNENIIANNTAKYNEDNGIYLEESNNNEIYLNNFMDNDYNVYSIGSTNVWNSQSKITYTYKGSTYTNYLGNYWNDYTGTDGNGDGLGDSPYSIDSDKDDYPLMAPWVNYFASASSVFDTGTGTYPSIQGTHEGTIIPSCDIEVSKMYTYSCVGTGGHTKSIKLYENGVLKASGNWSGYQHDWQNIAIRPAVTLRKGREYRYVIETGSYPQIIHVPEYQAVTGGTITCDKFTDANGKVYTDWIPAIRLS